MAWARLGLWVGIIHSHFHLTREIYIVSQILRRLEAKRKGWGCWPHLEMQIGRFFVEAGKEPIWRINNYSRACCL